MRGPFAWTSVVALLLVLTMSKPLPVPKGTRAGSLTQVESTEVRKAASGCDPNYAGACVPIASDVDCMSGNGNGPAYVRGPVVVIGSDIYGLDRNGNGIGCEKG